MAHCLISFGSNLGDRGRTLATAAAIIRDLPHVQNFRPSRLFETPAIGGPRDQPPFLNAVAAFESEWSAAEILNLLQDLELRLGRVRDQRWGARKIDLDVILHGRLVGGSTDLLVPHPRYTARAFVLRPALDVAPEFVDPRFGWSLSRLADHLAAAPPSLCLVGGSHQHRRQICQRLAEWPGLTVLPTPAVPAAEISSSNEFNRVSFPSGRWVSAAIPFPLNHPTDDPRTPRLLARLYRDPLRAGPGDNSLDQWPAPHQLWPTGRTFPEYALEASDVDWAAGEILSALDSMNCDCRSVGPLLAAR